MQYYIGVDTGGTFTDCVVMDAEGSLTVGKAPSTPKNFAEGIVDSVASAAGALEMSTQQLLQNTALFTHASTTATNALITGRGARTGLITTNGFEETVLVMRVMGKYAGLGEEVLKHHVRAEKPTPLVPRSLIRGINERVDYKGGAVTPIDRGEVEVAARELLDEGVEAIAVCFLWSQVAPEHERLVKDVVEEFGPGTYVTLSSDLAPVLGEYERTATTVVNSFLGPLAADYLQHLEKELRAEGLNNPPLIAQAHGGSLDIKNAADRPVSMVHSGPVCGIMGSQYLAELLKNKNVIATDMGGTSFDVGLIYDGRSEPATETVVNQYHLLVRWLAWSRSDPELAVSPGLILNPDAFESGPIPPAPFPAPPAMGRAASSRP